MKTETVLSLAGPLGTPLEIVRQSFTPPGRARGPRLSFVTGLHGDELEGLYLCHRLIRFLRELLENDPQGLLGEVHFYPAVNPPALNSAVRPWPFFGRDLNRTLGDATGPALPVQVGRKLMDDIVEHSDYVIDIHASNLYLKEIPQIRIIEDFAKKLLPLAALTNVDLVWVHPMAGLFESTLGYNLNRAKIPALVIETGICLRIHPEFGDRLLAGMLHFMEAAGILAEGRRPPGAVREPRVVQPNEVRQCCAEQSGLFVSRAQAGDSIRKGESIGQVIDPVRGEVLEEVAAPGSGLLFTLREHPLAYAGALLARVALDGEASR